MFGSQMLDIATALVLVFLMVSLMLTALQELIEAFLKKRARYLHDAIAQMLNDPKKADEALTEFYKLPSIFSLFVGDYDPKYNSNLPSYIPKDMFSQAILWMSSKNNLVAQSPAMQMLDHLKEQGIDLAQQQAELERWYDAVMERVSGQYKRNAQKWLLGLGVGVAVGLNINPIAIVTHLRQDPVALSKMVTLAERVHTASQEAAQDKVAPASDSGGKGEAGDGESPTQPPADTPSDPNQAASEPKSAKANAETTAPPPETVPCASSATDWSSLSACQSALAEAGIPLGWSQAALARTFPACYPSPGFWSCYGPFKSAEASAKGKKSAESASVEKAPGGKGPGKTRSGGKWGDLLAAIVGWFITGLAASLGAPFWFEMLGKIMTVRSSFKPKDAPAKPPAATGGTAG